MERGPRRLVLIGLLLAHALLAGAYAAWNPLGRRPTSRPLGLRRLPRQRRALPTGPHVTQSKHPPLYHGTAAAVASLAGSELGLFLQPNPGVNLQPGPNWSPNFFVHRQAKTGRGAVTCLPFAWRASGPSY